MIVSPPAAAAPCDDVSTQYTAGDVVEFTCDAANGVVITANDAAYGENVALQVCTDDGCELVCGQFTATDGRSFTVNPLLAFVNVDDGYACGGSNGELHVSWL